MVIDLVNGFRVTRHPLNCESAIMNPAAKVVALRVGTALKVLDLSMESTVKQHRLPEGDDIVFWRWLSKTMIAIVTNTKVYHWSMDGTAAPVVVFDRNSALEGGKVISYQVSNDTQWCALVAIKRNADGSSLDGVSQLYSVKNNKTQVVSAHAVCFAQVALNKGEAPATIFCFAEKKSVAKPTITMIEVGKDPAAGAPFKLPPQEIPFAADAGADFPISLIASSKHSIIYLVTKMGFLFLFDVVTGSVLFRKRISLETIFVTAPHDATSGVLGIVARKGQVLSFSTSEENLVPYIMETIKNPSLALQLAVRMDLPGADSIFVNRFNELLAAGQIDACAKLCIESPRGILRTPDVLAKFAAIPANPGEPQALLKYFNLLLASTKLNKIESIELCRPVLQKGRLNLVEQWLKEDKLECSEALGDMIMPFEAKMALSIYLRAQCNEKVVHCFLQLKQYDKIVAYSAKVNPFICFCSFAKSVCNCFTFIFTGKFYL